MNAFPCEKYSIHCHFDMLRQDFYWNRIFCTKSHRHRRKRYIRIDVPPAPQFVLIFAFSFGPRCFWIRQLIHYNTQMRKVTYERRTSARMQHYRPEAEAKTIRFQWIGSCSISGATEMLTVTLVSHLYSFLVIENQPISTNVINKN